MTNSFTIGFACSAALFVVLLGILLIFRKPLIQVPLSNMLIRELLSEMDMEDDEDKNRKKEEELEADSKKPEEEEELYEQL